MTTTKERAASIALVLALAGLASMPAFAGPWVPFEWHGATIVGKVAAHAAVVVPVMVDGRTCRFQLDTGADYRVRARSNEARDIAAYEAAIDQFLRDGPRAPANSSSGAENDSCGLAGDIGSGFFVGKALQLDFKGGRLRVLPSQGLKPGASASGGAMEVLTPPNSTGALPIIEIDIEGLGRRRALVDTGAASFGAVFLDAADWQAALKLSGADPVSFDAQREDGAARCQVAPGRVQVRLSKSHVHDLTPAHCVSSFVPPAGLSVVLGLEVLGDSVLTLDYGGGRWFATPARPHRE
ncbi:hypothetical protein [Roseateles chitinivorans]|uniref:hypothetical protein n=1 Tax=Roseateles chitinivorans TaxID=2917965 RepID=UPI003D66AA7F